MRRLAVVILIGSFVCPATTDRGSCVGRCAEGFNKTQKCQCESLCKFYKSCCLDYDSVCKQGRGDVFAVYDDEYDSDVHGFGSNVTESPVGLLASTREPGRTTERTATLGPESATRVTGTLAPEPSHHCYNNESFDAFTDLKNGSIFAFRGEYIYELDKHSVLPGYPKLISDVWGIPGPIDTAFTRVNCEGKTYIFKGEQYWRFDDGKLDRGYPKNIVKGFPGIPANLDASFSLPASSITDYERAYFFKGNQYWIYIFDNQPSRSDCLKTSKSVSFQRYAGEMLDPWESLFDILFPDSTSDGDSGPRSVSRDWRGLPSRLDAAMTGKLFMIRRNLPRGQRRRQRPNRGRCRGWWCDSSSEESVFHKPFTLVPSQSIYFFARDKYYRVDLETKRVAYITPPYPRSIARYWFKCRTME